jgi:hypothetical protein
VLAHLFFGFDQTRFYLRLDGVRRMTDVLADGLELSLTFLRPEGVRFVIGRRRGRVQGAFFDKGLNGQRWIERGPRGSTVAVGSVVEVALPLRELDNRDGAVLVFFEAITDAAGHEIERQPAHHPVQVMVPDERFEARNWTA